MAMSCLISKMLRLDTITFKYFRHACISCICAILTFTILPSPRRQEIMKTQKRTHLQSFYHPFCDLLRYSRPRVLKKNVGTNVLYIVIVNIISEIKLQITTN